MRRRLILGLAIQTALVLALGLYLTATIHGATDDVARTIRDHQSEILREDFLIRLRSTQADLAGPNLERARAAAVAVARLTSEGGGVDGCFGCHHQAESTGRLLHFQSQAQRYQGVLAAIAGGGADQGSATAAAALGAELSAHLEQIVSSTRARVEARTLKALEDIARARVALYVLCVAGPLLSALLGLALLRGLAAPLDALLQATRRLKAGDLEYRVQGLRDEFAELSASFNEMAASLQRQAHLMQRTEQLVVVGELAAGLVHEIKNPLAGIKAAMQLLSGEAALSAEDREVLDKVAREVVGLEGLLRSFLDFARPVRPQLTEVDLNGFVESVAAFYLRSHAAKRDCPVRIARSLGRIPLARVDPMQLQQVLLNLLLNAVDAMPDGGAVEVRTGFDQRANEVHIDIADGGRGISPAHAHQIFRPFFTTKPGGTGLGLAVSKRLVEQHGGSLSFTPNPGGGTVFRVQLPQAAPAGVATA